jgi:hypothetical protein
VNATLIAAAALVVALGLVHSLLGERYILIRLFRRADLPKLFGSDRFTRHTLRFAWHLTTVVWYGVAALLLALARPGAAPTRSDLGALVAFTALASAAVSLVGSRARHPAWLVFLAVAALSWFGTR